MIGAIGSRVKKRRREGVRSRDRGLRARLKRVLTALAHGWRAFCVAVGESRAPLAGREPWRGGR